MVAGDGTQRANVERAADGGRRRGSRHLPRHRRTTISSIELYADALAVIYPPFDEDFGYVTLEAFLARKPVITCTDSGGPNEFVQHGHQRLESASRTRLRSPTRSAQADGDRARAARLGDAGHAVAATITWDGVIEKLVALIAKTP